MVWSTLKDDRSDLFGTNVDKVTLESELSGDLRFRNETSDFFLEEDSPLGLRAWAQHSYLRVPHAIQAAAVCRLRDGDGELLPQAHSFFRDRTQTVPGEQVCEDAFHHRKVWIRKGPNQMSSDE